MKRQRICAICGSTKNLTKDHIPPKGIFSKPRPRNTITILTCEQCNQGSSKDDEVFRIWITANRNLTKEQWNLWDEKVVKSTFSRSPALKQAMNDDHDKIVEIHKHNPLKTYNGKILPDNLVEYAYCVEVERINHVVEKIIKGLYYHHFNHFLPFDVGMQISDRPLSMEEIGKVELTYKGSIGYFKYWYEFTNEKDCDMIWILSFFGNKHLVIKTMNN